MVKGTYVVIDDGSLELSISSDPGDRSGQIAFFPYCDRQYESSSMRKALKEAELFCDEEEQKRCNDAGIRWTPPGFSLIKGK